MKRIIAALLLLSLAASAMTAGCSQHPAAGQADAEQLTTESQYTAEADVTAEATVSPSHVATAVPAEKTFYVFDQDAVDLNFHKMFELDDSILFVTNERILFTDKEYKDWMPLCGKPNCSHKGGECNAFFEAENPVVWVYGRYIYYTVTPSGSLVPELWRMKLDGTDHELVAELRIDELVDRFFMGGEAGVSTVFHNRYVFVYAFFAPGGTNEDNRYYYYFELDHPENGLQKYELLLDGEKRVGFPMPIIYSRGDELYCSEYWGSKAIFKVDLKNMTAQTFCTLPVEEECMRRACYIDDKLYIVSSSEECKIVSIDLETGETETVNSDDTKLSLWEKPYGGYIIGAPGRYFGDENYPQGTVIYDMNGELIQSIPYEVTGVNLYPCYFADNYVFAKESGSSKKLVEYLLYHAPNWYLDIRDIGTDNLMWRRWEPEG